MSVYEIVLGQVREFYAHGKKSSNKIYNEADFVSEEEWDDNFAELTTRMAAAAKARNITVARVEKRNRNAPIALSHRSKFTEKTLLAYGTRIYNSGAKSEFTSGNCQAMMAVAGSLLINNHGHSVKTVYQGQIETRGDHSFCAVCLDPFSMSPQWATIDEMVPGGTDSKIWIVDPWLNVQCAAEDYWGRAQKQVAKWGQQGKRISWENGAQGSGWYNPGGEYAQVFGTDPLQWDRFDYEFDEF
jgi:hypothetical protein